MPILLMLLWLNIASAQDFIVNGTVNNTGTIRVKKQTLIQQGTVGGEIELKGGDQTLPAKQYGSVRLSGTGTKTTTGGNFTVSNNLTIAAAVTLDIPKGTVVTVGDTLFENGLLKGAVQKSVTLSGATGTNDFGRIGASISWTGTAPGAVTIVRASDSTQFGEGNQSIRRYYNIQTSDATKTGTVSFKYADSELNGHTASNLQLWRSTDNGLHWVRQIPVVDTLLKTLTRANVALTGLWTAADTVRALGPLKGAAGVPSTIASVATLDTLPVILTTLDSFKVAVTDIFGTPVAKVPVSFQIESRPTPGAGGLLSTLLDSTDDAGIARTVFTLGTKVGTYRVMATAPLLDTVRFTARAQNGAPQSIAALPLSLQTQRILTALDSAFTVQVEDVGGNAVDSAMVYFSIDSIPSLQAFDQDLSVDSIRTDALGRASTRLTLGSKVGTYKIIAQVAGVSQQSAFYASASPGVAATMARGAASNTVGIVGTSVDPFSLTVLDIGENPVPNEPVTFSISGFPAGSDTGRLSRTTVQTDALGGASTILTLGTRIGDYTVAANNATSGGSLAYKVTATHAPARTLAAASGSGQSAAILTTLASEFTAALTDTFGNPVDSLWVRFMIDSLSANGSGARLSLDSAMTDLNGLASTRLTLGYKTGTYAVKASYGTVPVASFHATAGAGAAAAMNTSAGAGQTRPILTVLEQPMTFRILDVGGNGVPGKSVQFSLASRPLGDTSAVVSPQSGITDSAGYVSTSLTLGSKVGTYTVKASVVTPAVADEAFTLKNGKRSTEAHASAAIETTITATAVHGAAAMLAKGLGDHQVNPTESVLDTAFVVTVRDLGGNPVPKDTVRFAVVSAPAGASQQTVLDSIAVTDSNGVARTALQLGTKEGVYTVAASVQGVPAALFTSTAYLLYGDLNKDIAINIGDITSLVDILTRRITATATDSAKADFNRDGQVDTLDIVTLRRTILDRSIVSTTPVPVPFLEDAGGPQRRVPGRMAGKRSASARTILEATRYGLRVNLENDEPVRGIELRLRLKDSLLNVDRVNMLFKRAEMMEMFVTTKDKEVRVLAYNLSNTPILPETSSVFRLPGITSLEMIDTTEVLLSLNGNTAAPVATEKVTAPVGTYPVTFRLAQNYPNPFNGGTTIEYDIPDGTEVTRTVIQVFNILGQRVKTLVAEELQPGRYSVRWDGTNDNGANVSTGVYFYRFLSRNNVLSKKMLYLR